ncbi:alpha/beta-hydrolase family protein [Ochrobactrum sp. Q0168]|uniref:alpha/beta hydrolase n=1 Tax=Ochrobactrum sp. Q0168 TaxID=2793241 RepID=UPI0018EDE873|nr:alpha/beta-hydrolase family protein [Ochrobactrum sp. Q0168]
MRAFVLALFRATSSFSATGLAFGTLFFAAALTPSLIPRTYVIQGALCGLVFAIGYGIGVLFGALWRYLELPEIKGRKRALLKIGVGIVCLAVALIALRSSAGWQNSIRTAMDMPPVPSAYPATLTAIAIAVFLVLLVIARILIRIGRYFSSKMRRIMPRRVANVIAASVTAFLIWTVANGVLINTAFKSLDASFKRYDALMEPDRVQPSSAGKTGSAASLIRWEDLGRAGREYIASAPTAAEISAFTGRAAMDPIRVYAGLNVSRTPEERARQALEELKRQGGFDRSALVIIVPTGTGWVDPSAMIGLEYLREGDVASIAVQYSYLNSPLSLLFQPEYGAESARALFETVYDYWKSLPVDKRPKIYLHGLSLGAFNSQSSVSLFEILDAPLNGALWSGPPFPSALWRSLTRSRNADTPEWLPVVRDGAFVRFMNQNGEAPGNGTEWGVMRTIYLQYASDAIVFFNSSMFYREPDWMKEPRGPDVSADLRWYPIVTALQLVVDMAFADSAPMGHGHVYAPEHYLEAWRDITGAENWQSDDINRLKQYLRHKVDEGNAEGFEERGG